MGLQHDGDNIKLVVKKNDRSNKPGQQLRTSKFSSGASSRKYDTPQTSLVVDYDQRRLMLEQDLPQRR